MKKGIYLKATIQPNDAAAAPVEEAALRQALAGTHDGLTVEIKRVRPAGEATQVILYLRGEQDPAADFAQWTTGVMRRLWAGPLGAQWQLKELVEQDDYVTEEDDAADQAPAAPPPARRRPKARKLRPKKKYWPWGRKRPDK